MKIVILCGKGNSSSIVFNKLNQKFDIEKVIVENSVKRSVFIKRRIKRLGLFRVLGQIAFAVLIIPILKKISSKRIKEIIDSFNMDLTPNYLNSDKSVEVESVNSQECINILENINPDVVIVNGTRIISSEVLSCVDAYFVNMHAGITPKYRGSHGAYWAFINNDAQNAGVTIHLIDEGIDTGGILYQKNISITPEDNFVTYPIIQTCIGVEYEIKAIEDIANGELKVVTNNLPSTLYSHPTFFQYLYHRIIHKIK